MAPPASRPSAPPAMRSGSGANGYSDEYPVGRFYRNCKGAVIYEGTREIHKIMQADYVLGFRQDRPTRCELPPYKG
jgi:glutaryl-CoA dehydrogenase (non-decarboxylating)